MANMMIRRGLLVAAGLAGLAMFGMQRANTQPTSFRSLQKPGDFPIQFWNQIIRLQDTDAKIYTRDLRDAISRYAYGAVEIGWEDQKTIANAVAHEEGHRRRDHVDNPKLPGPSPFPVPMPAQPPPPSWGRP